VFWSSFIWDMVHAGHKPTTEHAGLWRQMGLIHSFAVLLYTAIFLAWSVWRDAKGKSWMKPIARFVAIEQPSPQSSWLRNPRHNSAANLPDKGAGCEWFEATCGLEWNRALLMTPLTSRADIHYNASTWARWWHFLWLEYLNIWISNVI